MRHVVLFLLLTAFVVAAPRTRLYKASQYRKIMTPKSSMTEADQQLVDLATKNKTLFTSEREAVLAFRKRFPDKFGCRFGQEPEERPTFIPLTSDLAVEICYNPEHHAYGYETAAGWVEYDVFADPAALRAAMRREGFAVESDYFDVQYVRDGRSEIPLLPVVVTILVVAVVAGSVVTTIARRSGSV